MQITGRRRGISRAGEVGAAAVEFALVAPLLALVICVIVDLGRAYATLNQLAASVREGARLAAVMPELKSNAARDSVRKAVVAYSKGQLSGPEIASSSIRVDFHAVTGTITVTVLKYPFQPITPLARALTKDGTIEMTRRATFRWERAALPSGS
jgi:Flp pilus assembly protein TadG